MVRLIGLSATLFVRTNPASRTIKNLQQITGKTSHFFGPYSPYDLAEWNLFQYVNKNIQIKNVVYDAVVREDL